jgi:hypothetical protein
MIVCFYVVKNIGFLLSRTNGLAQVLKGLEFSGVIEVCFEF